jgi:hypothetical protein
MFRRGSPASATETGGGNEETLDELKRKKKMRRKDKLMTGLGFFTLAGRALFIKHALMGLYKDLVQNTGSYVLLNADDKRKA